MELETNIHELRALVVDDNLLNRKLVCAILKNHNIAFDVAENGKVAFDFFLSQKYDMILMDIQMPIMNGIQCTKKIREFEQKTNGKKPIPIIAVTAFAMENDRNNCIDAGMNEFIAKPFKAVNLLEIMSKFIEIKSIA